MKEANIFAKIPFFRNRGYDSKMLEECLVSPFDKAELVDAFKNLAIKLRPHIAKYDIVLGDDVSGRLPTLVIADCARRKREQTDQTPPRVYFVNAGSNLSESRRAKVTLPKLSKLIKKHEPFTNKKVLIVTEYMQTGRSVKAFVNELANHGITPDVCTVDMDGKFNDFKNKGGNFFYGSIDKNAGYPFYDYRYKDLTGLESIDGSPVAKKLPLDIGLLRGMKRTRRDMKLIASEMWKIIK